jgi:hypothetical protein
VAPGLREIATVVGSPLDWLEEHDKWHVRSKAKEFVVDALTKFPPAAYIQGLLRWLAKSRDSGALTRCAAS